MLETELRNSATTDIDKMSSSEITKVILHENHNMLAAVENASLSISQAVDTAYESIKKGGRIIYVGCGTSGRLGVLDASECPPTFGVTPDTVIGIIAGGDNALRNAIENVEDNGELGKQDLMKYGITSNDCVIGISAAGGARYVIGALNYAKEIGAATVAVVCNKNTEMAKIADIAIEAETGPEVIQGSTRMKAGTAQKIILNCISTSVMIKAGMVYENMMINLKPVNKKQKKRMINIVCEITGESEETGEKLLNENDWDIKKAVKNRRKSD